jgi:hypothetical protein
MGGTGGSNPPFSSSQGVSCLRDFACRAIVRLGRTGLSRNFAVGKRLGHTKVGFTPATYTHALQGMDEQAARKVGNARSAAIATAEKTGF